MLFYHIQFYYKVNLFLCYYAKVKINLRNQVFMFSMLFQKYVVPKNIIFTIILILFLVFLFKILDIAIMLFASFVIASSLNPLVDLMVNKYKKNRKTASLTILTGVIVLMLAFLIPALVLSGQEIKTFAISFPQYIDTIDDKLFASFPFLKNILIHPMDMDKIFSSLSVYAAQYMENIVDIGKNIGTALVYMIISLMFIFYFMVDKQLVKNTTMKLFPSQMRKRLSEIYDIISQKIGGYVSAQILTMLSIGVVMGIGLTIIGVKYSLLLAVLCTVLDIVPVVGPAVALIICIVMTYDLGTKIIIGVLVVFAIAQLIENQFVRPYVFGKFMDIHPIIIYLFLFITAKFLGVLGVVFAPAIAATVCVLIEELYMKSLE